MKWRLLILFCLTNAAINAQTDSLRKLLRGEYSAAEAVIDLKISRSFNWNHADSMIYYAAKTKEIADSLHLDTLRFWSLDQIAYAHYATGKTNEGISAGMQAYRIAGEIQRNDLVRKISNVLGLLYQNAGKYSESVTFFEESLVEARKSGKVADIATVLNNLANSLLHCGKTDSSLMVRREALKLRLQIGSPGALSDTYNDIAETFLQLNRLDSAEWYLDTAYEMKERIGDREMMSVIAMNEGELFSMRKQYGKAVEWFKVAEGHARAIQAYSYLSTIYLRMAELCRTDGKVNDAYDYLQLHNQFRDSVLTLESQSQINELNSRFQSEKKSLEIENLKKLRLQDAALADEKDKRNLVILLFSAAFLISISIYTIILFRKFRITREQKEVIHLQKMMVEEKNREITDSIHYAERLQRAQLPTDKFIDATLDRLKK